MPLYDFKCSDCEKEFEVNCKIAEKDNPKECPACGSVKTSQMVSAPRLGDSIALGLNQHQRAFKEVLNKIHKKAPGSMLNKTTEM